MNTVDPSIAPPPAAPAAHRPPTPSALRRLTARWSGTVVSFAVHGGFILLAFLSVAAPRTGRGGGIVGTSEVASGAPSYSALVQRDAETIDVDARQPDARAFPEPPAEEAAEIPEADPVPSPDVLKEQADAGVPIPRPAPTPDEATRPRSKDAYAKLPPSTGGPEENGGPSTSGGDQKGNSTVNGTGGDTGGAGDGTVGALFMPAPDYPASARRRGVEGIVVALIEVHPDGRCENARVSESSGNDALDRAALTAVRRWRYDPRPGGAVELRQVRFVFKLTN